MKALHIEHNGEKVYERYWTPVKHRTLLRFFSCAKSLTALAVGLLATDGQISLDAPVYTYFPEYPQNADEPWFRQMTIRDMLEMRTCFSKTTYNKLSRTENWVESFFTTKPDHPAGTIFRYDTSSAHVLAALVEKTAGKDILELLKERVLYDTGFSEWSYMVKDPFGVSMGGSGLMATANDMLRLGSLVMNKGEYKGEQIYPREFAEDMVSFKVSPYFDHHDFKGYGYMTWMIPGGFAFYGMGSQFVLMYPELSLVVVTAADTQKVPGAETMLKKAVYRRIVRPLGGRYDEPEDRKGMPMMPYGGSPIEDSINGREYFFMDNKSGFEVMSIRFGMDHGTLHYRVKGRRYELPFGIDELKPSLFPGYKSKCSTFSSWLDDETLYIKSWINDDATGSVTFKIFFGDDTAVVQMGETEETSFKEYNGIFNLSAAS